MARVEQLRQGGWGQLHFSKFLGGVVKVFDRLKSFALEQGIISTDGAHGPKQGGSLQYFILGICVCQLAFCRLLRIAKCRVMSILAAVKSGAASAPIDRRYLTRPRSAPSVIHGEICSFLDELYECVAEVRRLSCTRCNSCLFSFWLFGVGACLRDCHFRRCASTQFSTTWAKPVRPQGPSAVFKHWIDVTWCSVTRLQALPDGDDGGDKSETKHLPPGSIFDYWRQFVDLSNKCSYRVFAKVWNEEYETKLAFRTTFQHSVCPVCLQHKLLLRHLAHDSVSRLRQRRLYDDHLKSQYLDRRQYWKTRALSRLGHAIISLILDGMDQAKFMWPRSKIFSSHTFDHYHRPRLHISAAIVHGHFVALFVGDADGRKSGSTTVEMIAHIMQQLTTLGINLSTFHLNIQLDNTGSANKNNVLLAFLALQVLTGRLGSASVTFLRTGHTHEDIDQMFSALAGYLAVQLGLLAFRHSGTCAPISLIPPVGNHAVPQSARSLVL